MLILDLKFWIYLLAMVPCSGAGPLGGFPVFAKEPRMGSSIVSGPTPSPTSASNPLLSGLSGSTSTEEDFGITTTPQPDSPQDGRNDDNPFEELDWSMFDYSSLSLDTDSADTTTQKTDHLTEWIMASALKDNVTIIVISIVAFLMGLSLIICWRCNLSVV